MCEHIETLKKLTPILPEIPTFESLRGEIDDGFVEHKLKRGTAISFGIYNDNDISISKTFMSRDSTFEDHIHDGYEIIIVLRGTLELILGKNKKVILKKQEKYNITQNQVHSAKAITDVWLVALTVPKDERFPEKHYRNVERLGALRSNNFRKVRH